MRVVLLALLIVLVGALVWFSMQGRDEGTEDAAQPGPVLEADDTDPPEVAQDTDETVSLPRFDIVRVDRYGEAIIAGRAAPNAEIEILGNGEVIGTATAGADGSFAQELDTPLSEGPVELGLRMTTPDGMVVTGPDTIIIYVPANDGDLPVVLRTTPGGATEVLQRANDPDPSLGPLSIDSIDYDPAGNAIFSGRAEPNSDVQIFANRNPVGQTRADAEGRWELSTTIPPGRYQLQIIQLDETGAPKYAIEVPFEQAAASDVRVADGRVIVQPGNSLWVISRTVYGAGDQYTVIYEANADQIRDPDLIYPGQIFRLPEEDEAPEDGGDE